MTDKQPKTLTVGELREMLQHFPDNALVGFHYPSGDYWRTELFGEIRHADNTSIVYGDYAGRFRLLTEKELEDADDVSSKCAVVLLSPNYF